MCGILAIFNNNTVPKNMQTILTSAKTLNSRGPDSSSVIQNTKGTYFFKRLAINDLSIYGNQPIVDGNITLLCNGEIYNYKQLAIAHNIHLKSNNDCEIILHLYKRYGFCETVKMLDGDFAIVLVDGDYCYFARDRMGVRPLFIGTTEESYYAVASLAKTLLPFCTNVNQLIPGMCYLHIKQNNINEYRLIQNHNLIHNTIRNYKCSVDNNNLYVTEYYTHPTNKIIIYPQSLSILKNDLRALLIESVSKRLLSDRPIGCLLSGGLDSSIITAILVSLLGPNKVRTYSIGMDGSTDLYFARKVADHLGTKHTEVKFTPEEGLEVIPIVIKELESYDITTIRASVGMYLLGKYIKENTDDTVIFSGEGSDELFCGYLYFHNAPTKLDASNEALRLMGQLYLYDVLRADRMISCHGLELRVPFLDRDVIDYAIQMQPEFLAPYEIGNKKIEKFPLRQAFSDMLPYDVIWRQKCAFSDGVSEVKKSWYQYINEHANTICSEIPLPPNMISKEELYYKMFFNYYFRGYNLQIENWMPKWSDTKDPSARTLSVCTEVDV